MKLSATLAVWALLVAHSHAWAQPVRIETGLIEGIQSGCIDRVQVDSFCGAASGRTALAGAATRAAVERCQTS